MIIRSKTPAVSRVAGQFGAKGTRNGAKVVVIVPSRTNGVAPKPPAGP